MIRPAPKAKSKTSTPIEVIEAWKRENNYTETEYAPSITPQEAFWEEQQLSRVWSAATAIERYFAKFDILCPFDVKDRQLNRYVTDYCAREHGAGKLVKTYRRLPTGGRVVGYKKGSTKRDWSGK